MYIIWIDSLEYAGVPLMFPLLRVSSLHRHNHRVYVLAHQRPENRPGPSMTAAGSVQKPATQPKQQK